jgi:hypothetical protein
MLQPPGTLTSGTATRLTAAQARRRRTGPVRGLSDGSAFVWRTSCASADPVLGWRSFCADAGGAHTATTTRLKINAASGRGKACT